jgi:tRNA nucleotidyltransferase (CCA-adding enzyme)
MSRHLSLVETHLTVAQNAALARVVDTASRAGVSLFFTGGSMRDVLAGVPVRDLDLVVEGSASKLAEAAAASSGAELLPEGLPPGRPSLKFDGSVIVHIRSAVEERYSKPGGKAHVTPASIHQHLRSRGFTANAIAVSLTRASRGLLIDPNNGVADIEHRELRAVGIHSLFDRPVRLLTMHRLRVRLGFTIFDKTLAQYERARETGIARLIGPADLLMELRRAAVEPHAPEVLREWEQSGLLGELLPALKGEQWNPQGFAKLQKIRQMVPFGIDARVDEEILFFWVLTEKLPARERAALLRETGMDRDLTSRRQKLEQRAARAEKELVSPTVRKPSQVYNILADAPGEIAIFLAMQSDRRTVQDRVRNYLSRYLATAAEVSDADVPAEPGSPKFAKLKSELIRRRLDARPKPVEPPVTDPVPEPVASSGISAERFQARGKRSRPESSRAL